MKVKSTSRVFLASLALILALAFFAGCATQGTGLIADTPTANSLFANLSPELQALGPAALRVAADTAMIVRPEIKPLVAQGCQAAWTLVSNGNVAMGVGEIMNRINGVSPYTAVAVAFLTVVQEQIKFTLDPNDLNVFKSLVKNIGMDAGLTADVFTE